MTRDKSIKLIRTWSKIIYLNIDFFFGWIQLFFHNHDTFFVKTVQFSITSTYRTPLATDEYNIITLSLPLIKTIKKKKHNYDSLWLIDFFHEAEKISSIARQVFFIAYYYLYSTENLYYVQLYNCQNHVIHKSTIIFLLLIIIVLFIE